MLGAGVGAKIQGSKDFANAIGFGKRPQVVHQGLAFFRKTQFHKIQESRFVLEGELCAFTWEAESDQGGHDFGRRVESGARNVKDEFRASMELREDGEVPIITSAGLGSETEGDFGLNDEMNFLDEVGEGEKVMQDRRGDVVRQVSVDSDAASRGDRGKIRSENVIRNDREITKFLRQAAKPNNQRRVDLDSIDRTSRGEQMLRHFPVTRAYLDPAMLLVAGKRNGGMRRHANGPGDFFAPVKIGKKVLAEALASHESNSVASSAL